MSEQNLTIDAFLDKLQSAIYEKDFKELINVYETNKTEMDILFDREIISQFLFNISSFLFNISSNDTETIQKTIYFLQILNQNYPNLKLFKEIFKYCCFEKPPYTKRPFNIAKLIFPFVENDDIVIFQEAFKICCIYGKNMEMAKWIYEQKPSIEEPTHYSDNIFEETFEDEQITFQFMKFIYELNPDKISKNSFENVFSYKCDYIEHNEECQNNKIEILQWLYKTKPDAINDTIQNVFNECVEMDDYKTAYEIYKMKPTLQIIMDDDDADNDDDDDKFEKEEKLKFIQLLFKMNKNYFEN